MKKITTACTVKLLVITRCEICVAHKDTTLNLDIVFKIVLLSCMHINKIWNNKNG